MLQSIPTFLEHSPALVFVVWAVILGCCGFDLIVCSGSPAVSAAFRFLPSLPSFLASWGTSSVLSTLELFFSGFRDFFWTSVAFLSFSVLVVDTFETASIALLSSSSSSSSSITFFRFGFGVWFGASAAESFDVELVVVIFCSAPVSFPRVFFSVFFLEASSFAFECNVPKNDTAEVALPYCTSTAIFTKQRCNMEMMPWAIMHRAKISNEHQ